MLPIIPCIGRFIDNDNKMPTARSIQKPIKPHFFHFKIPIINDSSKPGKISSPANIVTNANIILPIIIKINNVVKQPLRFLSGSLFFIMILFSIFGGAEAVNRFSTSSAKIHSSYPSHQTLSLNLSILPEFANFTQLRPVRYLLHGVARKK